MKNSQWLKKAIALLNLKKNGVLKSIMAIIFYLMGKYSCQNENALFIYFDLIYFLIMYILISIMINYTKKDLDKENEV